MAKKKYSKQISVGYDSDGKRIRKRIYGDSKPELEQNIRKYWIETEKVSNPSNAILSDYADKWLETYKSGKSPRTYQFYKDALSPIKKNLGDKKVTRITKSDCQSLINKYRDKSRAAQYIRLTLNQVFNCAIDDGMISVNPARNLELPKRKPSERKKLSKDELEALRKADLNKEERMFTSIMLVFGLRPGEALALTPEDFDIPRKNLRISRAVTHVNNSAVIKGTKTDVVRDIPVPDQLLPMLQDYFKTHNGLLFSRDGEPLNKTQYRKLSDEIFKKIGDALGKKPENWTMYTFRHNRATDLYYLCQKGVISTKKAAELMGHSESIFLQIYSHIDETKEDTKNLYPDLVI